MMVTAEEFATTDIEGPIRNSKDVSCWRLGELYRVAASEEEERGNAAASRVYGLLSAIAHMGFNPEDESEPYSPSIVVNGRRSPIPSDFKGDQSTVFTKFVPKIRNPGLRARLADIARHNDPKLSVMAQQAIDAYCEAVRLLLKGKAVFIDADYAKSCVGGCDMLRRACQIARATGWENPQASQPKALVDAAIKDAVRRQDCHAFIKAGEVALQQGIGDPLIIATNAETFAGSKNLHPVRSRHLWELAVEAHRRTRNTDERNRCLNCVAETFVVEADAAGDRVMVVANALMNAIEILGSLPNTEQRQQRQQELRERLPHAQTSVFGEMRTASIPVDLTTAVEFVQRHVSGKDLAQALAAFAQLAESPDPSALKKEAQHLAAQYPLFNLISKIQVDEDGRAAAKSPGPIVDGSDSDALRRFIIMPKEGMRRHMCVWGLIEPARQLIKFEHPLHQNDLRFIVEMTPFVPADHVDLITKGLARFFEGDFFSALHILVPQLENTLRHILKLAGKDPSVIRSDMTQRDRTLSSLLTVHCEPLERILGPEIIFEIDNLFNYSGGPRLRHRLAHGKIPADECYEVDSIYACWFIFRLFCLPLLPDWDDLARKLRTP